MKNAIVILLAVLILILVAGCSTASGYSDSVTALARGSDHVTDADRHPFGKKMGFLEGVARDVFLTDNGVVIELTTNDPDVLARLQEHHTGHEDHPRKGPRHFEAAKDVMLIENGIRITITADDEETIAKIQEKFESGDFGQVGMHGPNGHAGGFGKGFWSEIEHDTTITENGVIVELSSSDPDVFSKLVERHERMAEGDHRCPFPIGDAARR